MNNKIYGGIYKSGTNKRTDEFIMDPTMVIVENEMVPYYLLQTIAHNLMLAKQNLVPKDASKKILTNLVKYLENNTIKPSPLTGDVHETTEKQLTKDIGKDAGWMHLARSRNEQSTNDQKLFAKDKSLILFDKLTSLTELMIYKSEEYRDTIMPGFTHTRVAMPSTFGFWWQSYALQTIEFINIYLHTLTALDKNPLGSGAAYGTNWDIDPNLTTKYQGYTDTLSNGLFAINSRGNHEAYLIGILANYFVTLSKMMEDIILWSTPEFNYIGISEDFTTGSSIMPQKMNPDIAEKVRSKSAKILANFNYLLMTIKGNPSGYNRDSAETKIAIYDSLQEALSTIDIVTDMLKGIVPLEENMLFAVKPSLATKLADELSKKYNIPFRQTHHIVGNALALVDKDINKVSADIVNQSIKQITSTDISVTKQFIDNTLNLKQSINQYTYQGSPNLISVSSVNKKIELELKGIKENIDSLQNKFIKAKESLLKDVQTFINS